MLVIGVIDNSLPNFLEVLLDEVLAARLARHDVVEVGAHLVFNVELSVAELRFR